jgi:predicted phosphate transport protein (TIGR00153 family)|tara:strand:- start:713 stop:1357 length:645 start_codon:yes stop_codon:yes gene_type:complete
MFLKGRNKQVQEDVATYLSIARKCGAVFAESIEHVLTNGLDEHFSVLVKQVHQAESNADDVRHKIAISLYEKSLLPESRGDLLTMLETMDRVPNKMEGVVRQVEIQKLILPNFLHNDLRETTRISIETFNILIEAVEQVFNQSRGLQDNLLTIDDNESLCDDLQQKMIRDIFEQEDDTGNKILLKDLVDTLASITDLCENVSNYVTIFHIKHSV